MVIKSFKKFISEAYNIFPKTDKDIDTQLSELPDANRKELKQLLKYLKTVMPSVETPIVLDSSKKNSVKVMRVFQSKLSIADIKKGAGLNVMKPAFGNGSSGNRGANNRGNAFENEFADALVDWWNGDDVKDAATLKAIEDLEKTYKLSSSTNFTVSIEGGENTPRPIQYTSGGPILTNTKGSGYNVGPSVTDITLITDNQTVFLSLKLGGTTTFFNVGVRTVLTPTEIKSGKILNRNGLQLLNTFGIDQKLFCDVFNGKLKSGIIDKSPKFNRKAIEGLLQSGIGYGYHIIHKMNKGIISTKMDKRAMVEASKVSSPIIYYGGKTGKGRRVDVVFQSKEYLFKINIRDTQGKDGYPTRMMCDFTHK